MKLKRDCEDINCGLVASGDQKRSDEPIGEIIQHLGYPHALCIRARIYYNGAEDPDMDVGPDGELIEAEDE